MKKRLRKKRRLHEFQEMGFSVKFDLNLPDSKAEDDFGDRLINAIESNHLLLGGGLNDFFVQSDSSRKTSESDRQAVEAWLRQQPEVTAINIGPLIDAWYGFFN
ncbi:50S ribosome-binding protein YggL [Hymenobacter terricola]|uniref:50S ribosome-binding protein YggL n=1 Tax=Hymenobacter terricola TaxID=2819236 RepID=UPI001B3032ED|nr:50S ribosome-binding protein YggL [Hymenobacter terricola]